MEEFASAQMTYKLKGKDKGFKEKKRKKSKEKLLLLELEARWPRAGFRAKESVVFGGEKWWQHKIIAGTMAVKKACSALALLCDREPAKEGGRESPKKGKRRFCKTTLKGGFGGGESIAPVRKLSDESNFLQDLTRKT